MTAPPTAHPAPDAGAPSVSRRAFRWTALALTSVLLLTGCSDAGAGGDQLQVVEDPERASAASAPPTTEEPAGRVVPADGDITDVATAHGTLAAAMADEDAVRLYDLEKPGAEARTVSLPGEVTSLTTIEGTVVAAMPDAGAFARIDVGAGEADVVELDGAPAGVAADGDRTLVALRDAKAVQ
ncbi:hypothetical protein FB384_005298, partial [Prauserella sediminis]|nr:hypothetical protein [Prauserella sediminis]